MVSHLDSDPCHSRAQDAALPDWVPLKRVTQDPRSGQSMLSSMVMMKDGRMQTSTLSVILILLAMRCEELILLLHTFIIVQTPAIQELWC